jgi:hypothetical protein
LVDVPRSWVSRPRPLATCRRSSAYSSGVPKQCSTTCTLLACTIVVAQHSPNFPRGCQGKCRATVQSFTVHDILAAATTTTALPSVARQRKRRQSLRIIVVHDDDGKADQTGHGCSPVRTCVRRNEPFHRLARPFRTPSLNHRAGNAAVLSGDCFFATPGAQDTRRVSVWLLLNVVVLVRQVGHWASSSKDTVPGE